jgi:hypothetical protein
LGVGLCHGSAVDHIPGVGESCFALELALDFGPRKNEAKRLGFGREVHGGIVVAAFSFFGFRELDEEAGFVVGFDDGVFAAGLESPQFGRVLFDGTADALLVCGEQLKILRLSDPGAALGEGSSDFRVGGIGIGMLLKSEGEEWSFRARGRD